MTTIENHNNLVYIHRSILDPTSNSDTRVNAGSVEHEKRACNLVTGARFEVDERSIILRDEKPKTSCDPLDQRAEFYTLKRNVRDARCARARPQRSV